MQAQPDQAHRELRWAKASALAAIVAIPVAAIGIFLAHQDSINPRTVGVPLTAPTSVVSLATTPGVAAPATTAAPTSTTVVSTTTNARIDLVLGYYALMPNTEAGWELIGPHLRLRTRESYERFWSQFRGVEVLGRPTVEGEHVTVRIALYYRDERPKLTETHVLGVTLIGDQLKIDSDAVTSTR